MNLFSLDFLFYFYFIFIFLILGHKALREMVICFSHTLWSDTVITSSIIL